MKKIAVLITCHNRRETTLKCLDLLFKTNVPVDFTLDVFLVDDHSTDGTEEAVKNLFPHIKVINGDGNLYWNRGMRLAWQTAKKAYNYDYYLWLNDDTRVFNDALIEIIKCSIIVEQLNKKPVIITGACCDSNSTLKFSYGGHNDKGPIIPNGNIQQCKYINGNLVLVPESIFNVLGNLASDYTHAIGDYDYGLRAIKAGFNCYTTTSYVAECSLNNSTFWCDPSVPLLKRIKFMYSPKGLNIREYLLFRKKFWGWRWIISAIKAHAKVISPIFYKKITNK